MLDLAKTDTPYVAELPDLRLKSPVIDQVVAQAMPLAALRETVTLVERSLEEVKMLTFQAESHGETLVQRAEKAEEARRWLEAENRELHDRLQKLEEKIPRWVRKLLGA